jgi:hypothetical protein
MYPSHLSAGAFCQCPTKPRMPLFSIADVVIYTCSQHLTNHIHIFSMLDGSAHAITTVRSSDRSRDVAECDPHSYPHLLSYRLPSTILRSSTLEQSVKRIVNPFAALVFSLHPTSPAQPESAPPPKGLIFPMAPRESVWHRS